MLRGLPDQIFALPCRVKLVANDTLVQGNYMKLTQKFGLALQWDEPFELFPTPKDTDGEQKLIGRSLE